MKTVDEIPAQIQGAEREWIERRLAERERWRLDGLSREPGYYWVRIAGLREDVCICEWLDGRWIKTGAWEKVDRKVTVMSGKLERPS